MLHVTRNVQSECAVFSDAPEKPGASQLLKLAEVDDMNKQTTKRAALWPLLALAAALAGTGCATKSAAAPERETLYQVSLLQGLMLGDYHGSVSVAALKTRGDTGIGTFDRLNGELIMVDGGVYRAAEDGRVSLVPDQETVPFANVTFFDADAQRAVQNVADFAALRSLLDEQVRARGPNRFYMIRLDGHFGNMRVRSERPQSAPYRPLAKVMETDQTLFTHKDIRGTVVGLYCPVYMNQVNTPGWHLHFVSEDRTQGGHVLDLSVTQAELSLDDTGGFAMLLPDNPMFRNFDFSVEQAEDVRKVEQGQ